MATELAKISAEKRKNEIMRKTVKKWSLPFVVDESRTSSYIENKQEQLHKRSKFEFKNLCDETYTNEGENSHKCHDCEHNTSIHDPLDSVLDPSVRI